MHSDISRLLLQPPFSYGDLRSLTQEEYRLLERIKCSGGTAARGGITKREKAECQKYVFLNMTVLNPDSPSVGPVYDFVYSDSEYMRKFENVRRELTSTPRQVTLQGIRRTSYPDLLQNLAVQLEGIHKLTALLGLKNSTDTDSLVSQSTLETNMEAIQVRVTRYLICCTYYQTIDCCEIAGGCVETVQRPEVQKQIKVRGEQADVCRDDPQYNVHFFQVVFHDI